MNDAKRTTTTRRARRRGEEKEEEEEEEEEEEQQQNAVETKTKKRRNRGGCSVLRGIEDGSELITCALSRASARVRVRVRVRARVCEGEAQEARLRKGRRRGKAGKAAARGEEATSGLFTPRWVNPDLHRQNSVLGLRRSAERFFAFFATGMDERHVALRVDPTSKRERTRGRDAACKARRAQAKKETRSGRTGAPRKKMEENCFRALYGCHTILGRLPWPSS